MTYHTTEQEQVEQLKHWFKAYGVPVIIGLVVGVIFLYAWQYYQATHLAKLEDASRHYDIMLTEYLYAHAETAHNEAKLLTTTYPNTIYAMLARLLLAKLAVDDDNLAQAQQELEWLVAHAPQADIKQISRVRLARIFLYQHHAEQALQILTTVDHKSFMTLIDELRGDAYMELNKLTDAKAAYQAALDSARMINAGEVNPLLQFKFDNLP